MSDRLGGAEIGRRVGIEARAGRRGDDPDTDGSDEAREERGEVLASSVYLR